MKVTELDHKPHPSLPGTQAIVQFKNGFGASIISGSMFYSRPGCPYEIAVLDSEGKITYDTPITDDVCGYLTEEEANELLAQIEALPPNQSPSQTLMPK